MNWIPYASSFWSLISQWTSNKQNAAIGNLTEQEAVSSPANSTTESAVFFFCDVSSSFYEKTASFLNDTVSVIYFQLTEGNLSEAIEVLRSDSLRLLDWFAFSDFQLKLLREFSLILAGNIFLVLLAWKVYGPRISGRFSRPVGGSRKVIEELRVSMSELQLPKEHDYKFK